MTKEELRELAQWGMRKKLKEIEEQIAEYQAEFPDLFVSEGRIVLLKAEPRENGENAWLAPAKVRAHAGTGETNMERVLAYLREHPLQAAGQIAKALSIKPGIVHGLVSRLNKERKIWKPEGDGRYAIREKALRQRIDNVPVVGAAKVGRPKGIKGQKNPDSLSSRVGAFLLAGGAYGITDLQKRLKAKSPSSVHSAMVRAEARGEVIHEHGLWRAVGAPQKAKSEQPALPLALDAKPPTRRDGQGRHQPGGARYWKERWYAQLTAVGEERVTDSAAALGTVAGTLAVCGKAWLDLGIIKKVGPGRYAVGSVKPPAGVLAEANRALEASRNGATA